MKTKKITLFILANALCLLPFSLSAKDIFANSTSGDDTKDGSTAGNSVLTVAQAYTLASDGDVIKLEGTFLVDQNLTIEKAGLTIQSVGTTKAVLDGGNNTWIFDLKSSITLKNLTFSNGYGADGGALSIPLGFERDVKIEDCLFKDNQAGGRGGAIWCQTYGLPDKVTINRCVFTGNNSGSHGGAIGFIPEGGATNKAVLTINNSTFAQNFNTAGGGGVLFVDGGATAYATFNVNNVTISGNHTFDNGGNCPGFRFIGNQMAVNIKNSIIEGNHTKDLATKTDGDFYDISFTDTPQALTIQNSIIGNVTVNGGTTDPSNFIAIGSNVNNMTVNGNESVAGLGDFTDNHYLLTNQSLAYNYGLMQNVTPETVIDQLGHTRSDATKCSAGAVEYFSFLVSAVDKTVLSAANISSLKGVIKVKAENATAEVYNISGILVNKMLVAGEASIPVTPGVYIVIVASSTNKSTSKVIVN